MSKQSINYKRHRFPPEIITHAVWLYCRFNLSFREVEEMFLQSGVDVSYETIRRWVAKFGPAIACSVTWHLNLRLNDQRFQIDSPALKYEI